MSVRANLVLVGAPYEDGESDGQVVKELGAAYLYARDEGAYVPVARLAPEGARSKALFGYSTAFGERILMIGGSGGWTCTGPHRRLRSPGVRPRDADLRVRYIQRCRRAASARPERRRP